jgi:hypothetical protein
MGNKIILSTSFVLVQLKVRNHMEDTGVDDKLMLNGSSEYKFWANDCIDLAEERTGAGHL